MKKITGKVLSAQQLADLAAVAELPDEATDTSGMPEQVDWSGAQRGQFYRPVKKQITLRIDADLIEWFRQHTPSDTVYQTLINDALRKYMAQQGKQ